MRKIIRYIAILIPLAGSAQSTGESGTPGLPDIVPPAPSVAALMKIEEVPVDNYTGNPDISVPLHGFALDSGLSLNVGISYSTTGVRIDEIPSWVGTGWSLTCGGSISRTMLSKPDDAGMVGVLKNGFYDIPVMTDEELEVFLWNANRFGRDTEPDLFQYNFMGQSGRFVLKKDRLTGVISPVSMNGDKVHKISVSLDTSGFNIQILGFTIVDDFGYTYTFGSPDKTASIPSGMGIEPYDDYFSAWHLLNVKSPDQRVLCTFGYQSMTESYVTPTSYTYNNLKAVNPQLDILGKPIAFLPPMADSFSWITIQSKVLSTVTIPGKGKLSFSISNRTQPLTSTINYQGYKLNSMAVKNANDETLKTFVFNTSVPQSGQSGKLFLNSIDEVYPQGNKLTHKFWYKNSDLPRFDSKSKDYWGYYNGAVNQSLSPVNGAERSVNSFYITNGLLETIEYPTAGRQKFEFEPNTYSYIGDRLLNPMDPDEIPENRQFFDINQNYASSQASNNNMIIYVHGDQFVNFAFKATSWTNTFPHSKNDILGFSVKLTPLTPNSPIDPYGTVQPTNPSGFTAGTPKWVAIKNCGALPLYNAQNIIEVTECNQTMLLSGWYNVQLAADPLYLAAQPVNYNLKFRYFKMSAQTKITKGGGVRIRKTELRDQSAVKSATTYAYNRIDDSSLSSGSQSMASKKKPYYIFRYEFAPSSEVPPGNFRFNRLPYLVYDDQNGLDIPLNKGNYVGYKNVTVAKSEATGGPFSLDLSLNGRTEFVYTSSLDYDDMGNLEDYYTTYPFEKPLSRDYKRGLLLEKRIFGNDGKILNRENFDYEFSEDIYEFGFNLKPKDGCDCPVVPSFSHYTAFKGYLVHHFEILDGEIDGDGPLFWQMYWDAGPFVTHLDNGGFNCVRAQRYLYLLPNKYLSGWARMKEKQSDNYYYANGGSTASIQSQKERYTYNFSNKQISEVKRELSPAESYTTKYYYPNDAVTATILPGGAFTQPQFDALSLMKQNAQHRISVPIQTLTYKNAELIQTQRTLFRNWQASNGLVLPEIVQASKGSAPLENRVIYSAIDFSNGNPLEVRMANGTPVSYIWGYNKTQPVAKIENMSYASIPAGLIIAVQNASNASPYVEADLLTALSNLRAAPELAGAMVTTFTYKPLVGVTTATDPKGQTVYYDYDAFFRLKAVKIKDANGDFNILSSNEYNYKPQSLFP